ncbi:EAL domain-containing protein [Virgibacillus flavescens]|uniref:EAL domain-containing protein n=1 Tax=Virgibacillus flavescens TaxID=1611422 RepID=UPI003D3497B3
MNNEVRSLIKNDLNYAIVRKELSLCFQPQVKLATGEIIGTEALLRWRHPEHGWIPPSDFIPIAEETGMIHDLTKWVMKEACRQNKAWHDMGLPKITISVNISSVNFKRFSIYEMIVNTLKETQLEPHYLELEVTESAIMEDIHGAKEILHMLKTLGIRIAIDDFGVGNSSLSYLRELPIDVLKIDRSFINNVPGNVKAATIVKNVIHLAQNIGLTIVAEGVETDKQVIFLSLHNCHIVQGYLFSKPLFADKYQEDILKYEKNAIIKMAALEQEIDIASLKYNDNRFYSLFEYNPDAVCSIDLSGNILSVNPAFEHILGYTEKELLYKKITSLVLSCEILNASEHFSQVIKMKSPKSIELTLTHKSNSHFCFSVTCLPILLDEKIVGVYCIGKKLSNQRSVEQNLTKKTETWKLIADNITDLVLIIDSEGIIHYASPSHKETLGVKPGEMEGEMFAKWIHPDDLQNVKDKINILNQVNEPSYIEFRIRHDIGHYLLVESHLTRETEKNDQNSNIVTILREITPSYS